MNVNMNTNIIWFYWSTLDTCKVFTRLQQALGLVCKSIKSDIGMGRNSWWFQLGSEYKDSTLGISEAKGS